MDVEEALAENADHIVELVLVIVESQVESIVPNFFELLFALVVIFSNFKVSVNCFTVFSLVLPDFTRVEDFLT